MAHRRGRSTPDDGIHRRRWPGRAGDVAAARPVRHRLRRRREEPDHDRSSEVARLLGAHDGDLPAMGHRAAIRDRGLQDNSDMFVFSSRASRAVSSAAPRPEPNLGQTPAWKSLVAQDAVEEEIHARRRTIRTSCHRAVLHRVRESFEETNAASSARSATRRNDRRSHRVERDLPARLPMAPAARPAAAAGIEMVGPATLAVMSNEYWRADLSRFPIAREAAGYHRLSRTSPACRAPAFSTPTAATGG